MPSSPCFSGAVALSLLTGVGACRPSGAETASRDPGATPSSASMRGALCPEGTQVQGAAPPDGAALHCARPDGRKHGPAREWTSDGRLVAEGAYVDGQRDGIWRTFHANGVPRTVGEYARGEMVGTWHEWDAEGAPVARFVYEADGRHVQETQWWPGPLKSRGTTKDGVPHGRVVEHDAKGKVVRDAEYENGELVRDNLAGASGVPVLIGVPACDEYIAMYRRCIDEKVPQEVREQSRKALDMSLEAWRQAASTPAGREGLAQACATARDAVKASCGE